MEDVLNKNPWLGLKSYGEKDRLYGRDADIRALTQAVVSNGELLFFGKSGIGKSSILMAGLVGMCRANGYVPVVVRLEHGEREYVEQIREALLDEGVRLVEREKVRGERELLWEFFHRYEFWKEERVKVLLIFDQFEEIFTLTKSTAQVKEFFAELADYLNDVRPRALEKVVSQEEVRKDVEAGDLFGDVLAGVADAVDENYVYDNEVHTIFTIREDFLSEFEYYARAIPSLKQHRYLLRPLNEEQAAEVIMKPCPGLVSKEVAKLIIEKVTGRNDVVLDGVPDMEVDAAVLSLYLEQLYEAKEGSFITRDLVEEKGGHIIEAFYEKVAAQVPSSAIEYLENELINDDGRRENRAVSTIQHNIGEETLEKLLSLQLLRQFRRGDDLMVEFIHDILCPVIQKRKELRVIEKRMNRRRRVMRWVTGSIATLLVLTLLNLLCRYLLVEREYAECYADFVRVNGYPVGIGEPLSQSEIGGRMVAYRLVRRGYSADNRNIRIEVVRKDSLAASGIEFPLVGEAEAEEDVTARSFARRLQAVTVVKFRGGSRLNQEVGYDKDGNVMYRINYFDEGRWRWACFINENGSAMRVRKNTDRMKIMYDEEGRAGKVLFYDASLVPQRNYVGFYGIELSYDESGRRDTVWTLDPFGDRLQAQIWKYDGKRVDIMSGDVLLYSVFHNDDGTVAQRVMYAKEGDDVVTTYEYKGGRLACMTTMAGKEQLYKFVTMGEDLWTDTIEISKRDALSLHWHTVKDEKGRSVEVSYFDASTDMPIINKDIDAHLVRTTWTELKNGCVRKIDRYYDTKNRLMDDADGTSIGERVFDADGKLVQWLSLRSDGTRVRAMRYEYKNGVEYCRYAIGVDNNPIRCASLERDGMVYYKLKLKVDAFGNFVNGVAINEWGEQSVFYFENTGAEEIREMQAQCQFDPFVDGIWNYANVASLKYTPPADMRCVDYIHILSKDGEAYKAGLRDGDVIVDGKLRSGGTVSVKRLGRTEKPRTIVIGNGELEAEHYDVYLTKEEYEKL